MASFFSDRSIWLVAPFTPKCSLKAAMTSLPMSKPSQNASYPPWSISSLCKLLTPTAETGLCLDCPASLLAACCVPFAASSLTVQLSRLGALQSSDLVTLSSCRALDKRTRLYAKHSQSLLSPLCLWEVKDKTVCWFHHPSNLLSLVTWKCPSKQDHSPQWKGSCSAGSSVWWSLVTTRVR